MAQSNTPTAAGISPLNRLYRLLGLYKKEIRYILLYALVAGLINLSLPLGIQAILGQIAGGRISASWGILVLFVVVGAVLTGLLRLAQLSVTEHMQRRLFADSAIDFGARIPRLNLEQLRREYLPELANRFFDTLTLQKLLPKVLIDGSTAILQIFFSLILLSLYHAAFFLLALLLLTALTILLLLTAPKGLETSLKESKYKYKLVFWLEEVGRIATTFQLSGENRFPVQKADEMTVDYLNARAKHWRILVVQFAGGVAFKVLILGVFLILGSVLVMQNQLNIGQFVASEILVLYIVDSIDKIILLQESVYDLLTATEKIGQISDLPVERDGGVQIEELGLDEKGLDIALRNFSYQYEDAHLPVLKNLNLQINPGDRLAIVGYNGAGKSTLVQALSVMKSNFTGSLLFNGLPLQNLDLRSLRSKVGDYSSQEDVFKGSLLENITLGRKNIALEKVLQALDEVGLEPYVNSLPNGIDTELLPGGKGRPRSFITKILIARAIVTQPKLLVIEEPMYQLNLPDRMRIANLLCAPHRPWTLITVTEDPILAALCNKLVVLEEGSIVFEGNFDALRKTVHFDDVIRIAKDSTHKS